MSWTQQYILGGPKMYCIGRITIHALLLHLHLLLYPLWTPLIDELEVSDLETFGVSSMVVPIASMVRITTFMHAQSRKPLQTVYLLRRPHYTTMLCCVLNWETYVYQICSILDDTLEAVGAKAMVVGHTPQLEGVNWYTCPGLPSIFYFEIYW